MFMFLKHDDYYKTQSWNVFVALRAVWWEMLLQIWKERNKALVQCLIYNQKGERNLLSFPMGATSTWGKRWMLPKNSSQANNHVSLLIAVQALGSTSCCGFRWGWKLVLEVIQWSYIVTLSFEFFSLNSLRIPCIMFWSYCPFPKSSQNHLLATVVTELGDLISYLFVWFLPLRAIYVAHILFHMWASIGTQSVFQEPHP